MRWRNFGMSAMLLATAACGQTGNAGIDGGPPRALEVLDGAGQIGLAYDRQIALRVRYRTDDAALTPLGGAEVRFSIFGDPQGSTLSRDRATTGSDGVAEVLLTAGAAEASFAVTATCANAPPAQFDVSVSKQPFAEIDADLQLAGTLAAERVEARLYTDRTCAQLPSSPAPPAAFRTLAQAGTGGTLAFVNLLSMRYAVLGRALDGAGKLVADACADLPANLVPAGTRRTVLLTLRPALPALAGRYQVTSTFSTTPPPARAAWTQLVACTYAPAQPLLDTLIAQLDATLGPQVAAERGAPTGGCRPAMVSTRSSLDADLNALFAGGPVGSLPAIVADLNAMTGSAQLGSTLVIALAAPGQYAAEHALGSLSLKDAAGAATSYDLVAAGLPIIDVRDVPISAANGTVQIGRHAFTLGLERFQRRAVDEVAIAPRVSGATDARSLLGAVVAVATHGGRTGCAGLEDLVCSRVSSPGCVGAIAPACSAALDAMAGGMEAAFAPVVGLDLTLAGQARGVDRAGNLVVDHLEAGVWAQGGTFQGSRIP